MDYYNILGVPRSSTAEEIKGSYRTLCKKYHPDLPDNKGIKSTEDRMKEINLAYDTLGDAEKRKKYDNPQHNYSPFNNTDHTDIHNIMHQFFSGQGGFRFDFGRGGQQFTQIINIEANISIFTLILGGPYEVALPTGETKKISIPPGSPLNAQLHMKENNIEIRVHLIPVVPSITEEQMAKLKEIFPQK